MKPRLVLKFKKLKNIQLEKIYKQSATPVVVVFTGKFSHVFLAFSIVFIQNTARLWTFFQLQFLSLWQMSSRVSTLMLSCRNKSFCIVISFLFILFIKRKIEHKYFKKCLRRRLISVLKKCTCEILIVVFWVTLLRGIFFIMSNFWSEICRT